MDTILTIILSSSIGFIVSGVLGFLAGKVKSYKKQIDYYKDELKELKESSKCLLRSSITSQYFVYKKLGSTPSYEKENMNYMHSQYKSMGGNSYIDELMDDFNNLPIKEG